MVTVARPFKLPGSKLVTDQDCLIDRPSAVLINVKQLKLVPQKSPVTRKPGEYLRVKAQVLHRRGISRDNIEDTHPPPENADDYLDGSYPYTYMGDVRYSIGQPTSYSRRSSHDDQQSDVSHSMFSIGGTTGNTTERSSVYSLGEDNSYDYSDYLGNREFEREATQKVRAMFEEIDNVLFEDVSGPTQLTAECLEWGSVFPHLRVLGHQVVPPQDDGVEIIEGDSTPRNTGNELMDVTEHDISHSHALNELSITGQHVQAYQAPADVLSSRAPDTGRVFSLREEIIEQDGEVEDIIAIDYRANEDDSRSIHTNRTLRLQQRGLPPMTPKASVRDDIRGAAFDYLWSEIISWLRELLKHYADNIVLDQDDMIKQQRTDTMPPSIVHGFSSPRDHPFMPSRESSLYLNQRSSDKKGLIPNPQEGRKLEDLLTISSKEIIGREKTGDPADGSIDRSPSTLKFTRPVSNLRGQPISGKNSARYNKRVPGKLAPLERAKTPNVEEERAPKLTNEGVRGRGIATYNEKQTSPPPVSFSRNSALPPIGFDSDQQLGPLLRKKFNQRSSSAVHNDKEARTHIKEKEKTVLGVPFENRPSTTHDLYRSETPLGAGGRRSSTPVGFSQLKHLHGVPAVSRSLTPNNVNLNVTGSSINPHIDSGLDVDDAEQGYDDISSQRWEPTYRRLVHSNVFRHYEGASTLTSQNRRPKQQHSP